MILETLRMVTAALQSSVYGVNVQLAGMTFDNTDSGPTAVQTIGDVTSNPQLATGTIPQGTTYPAVFVSLHAEPDLTPEIVNNYRDGTLEVLITAVLSDINAASAAGNTFYILKAIEKTLRQFNSNLYASDRSRNNIQVLQAVSMTHAKLFSNPDDGVITGALQVSFLVRDIDP